MSNYDAYTSAQQALENEKILTEKLAEAEREKYERWEKRNSREARDGSVTTNPFEPKVSQSSLELIKRATVTPLQEVKARREQEKKNIAAREAREAEPKDTRTSAQKLADRFGFG